MNKKSFANSFTEDYLKNNSDLEQLFIDNEIYIPYSYDTYVEFDENLSQFLTKEEIEKERNNAKKPITTNSYKFNPNLINEIYNSFLFEISYIDDYVEYKVDTIRMLLNLAHNQERKKEIIEKHLKKAARKIAKIDLSEDLFHLEDHIDLTSESSQKLIKNSISLEVDSEIVIDFLIHGNQMSYFEHDLFKEYYDIDFNQRLINKLKEISNKINKSPSIYPEKNIDTLNKNTESNYPLVFKSLMAENLFIRFLKETNAIDKNNKPINRRFQPLCDAFFRASSVRPDNKLAKFNILTYKCLKKNYLQMLEKHFKLPKSISKLSSGTQHVDEALNFLSNNPI